MTETSTLIPQGSALPRDKAQTRYLQILEATTDVVAMSDRRGRLLFLNRAGRNLFGWPAGEMARRHLISELYPPWVYQVILHDAIPTAIEQGSWSGETALNAANGREIPVLQVMLAHHGTDGEMEFFSTICRDISDRKQKELERIEWANRYDAAIRASGQVLFDWDSTSGAITYGGDVHRLLGYSAEEMSGGLARLREVIHPADLPAFDQEVERVLFSRDPFHHEFRAKRKNAEEICIEAEGFFFLDRQGRIGRMVGFLRNVTVERAAELAIQSANERLEQRVAERTAALELSARRQEAVARLGQRALAGMALDQLMQEAVEIAHHGLQADFGSVLEYDADNEAFIVRAEVGWPMSGSHHIPGGTSSQSGYAMLTGKAVVCSDISKEHRFTVSETARKSDARSGMSTCIQAGDRPLGVVSVFHRNQCDYTADDVNFLQSVANVLTAAIERQRVENDLRRARADAEAANRGKSEFLSRMSHELRTPLNAILGFTQLLEMEEHNARQAESIEHITRAGQNLLSLINEVLDIARIDAGRMQMHIEPVELPEILRESIALISSTAMPRGISVTLDVSPADAHARATADRERLKQAILNLLSNAVKFNRPSGFVSIKLERAGARWRIVVTDSGCGIAEDKLPQLFVPFQRSGPNDRAHQGTGLGLALSQKLITAFGGQITVTSTLNVGSTFTVELPAVDAAPSSDAGPATPPAEPKPATPETPPQRCVLYVEDDVANFYLLERILQSRKDIKLVSALQGSLGLELAKSQKPDLILLDLNLPDMSGEQLLRALKADPQTAHIPVVAVTGEVGTNRPEALRSLGALGTLVKPYRVQELTKLVDAALAKPA